MGSTSSALARLSKPTTSGGVSKQEEKKETPQERLKRIMSRQLNKQSIPCSMCILVVKQPCSVNFSLSWQSFKGGIVYCYNPFLSHMQFCNIVVNLCFALILVTSTVKKDTAVEMAKKKEQERQRNEKLAETSRLSRHRRRSHSRSYSRSPPRYCNGISFSVNSEW